MHLTKKYTKLLFVSSAIASFGLVASSHAQAESNLDSSTIAFGGDPNKHEIATTEQDSAGVTSSGTTAYPSADRKVTHKTTTKKLITKEIEPIKNDYVYQHQHKYDTRNHGTSTSSTGVTTTTPRTSTSSSSYLPDSATSTTKHSVTQIQPSKVSDIPTTSSSQRSLLSDDNDTIDSAIRPTPKRENYLRDSADRSSTSSYDNLGESVSDTSSAYQYHKPQEETFKTTTTKTYDSPGARDVTNPSSKDSSFKDTDLKYEKTTEKTVTGPKGQLLKTTKGFSTEKELD